MGTRSCAGEQSGRKGKKSGSEKPKQPQRGLGVAQLEKMRMSSQMGLYHLPSFHVPFNLNRQDETVSRSPVYVPSSPPSLSSSSSAAAYGYLSKNMVGMGDPEGTKYYDFQSEAAKVPILCICNTNLLHHPIWHHHAYNCPWRGCQDTREKNQKTWVVRAPTQKMCMTSI